MTERAARRAGRPPTTVDGKTVPERIVNAAVVLFADKGFTETSVQDLVAEAGATKGAMYHYFDSKEDVLYEIYGRILRMQHARLEQVVLQERPTADRLHAACADVVETTVENLQEERIFFTSLHLMSAEKQRKVRRERRRYHEAFRELIREGQLDGTFRKDVSPDICVDYYFGAVHHLPTWFNPRGAVSARKLAQSYADLFLDSLTRHP